MFKKDTILEFSKNLIHEPFISDLIKRYDVDVNIKLASIKENSSGRMFVVLNGEEARVNTALKYLQENGVTVLHPTNNLVWAEDKCVHCGACISHCHTNAFVREAGCSEVQFDETKCVGCNLCIPACRYDAIKSLTDCFPRH